MKTDAKSNVSASAGTSPTIDVGPSVTEADFLKQEAARAKAAITDALADLGRSLKATADPHVLTRDHPWIAVAAAALAGFAAASSLVPSKEQQALRALAEIERARHTPPTPATSASATSDKAAAATGGIVATLTSEAVKLLRPVLTTLLTAGISRATGNNGNGHSHDAAASGDSPNGPADADEIPSPS